jgi:hypothetical protein
MCQRLMALDQNGEGRKMYRCKHRGQGCAQPRRTNVARRSRNVVGDLEGQRRKLLRLYYDDRIGADLFAEEEARLAGAIKAAQREDEASQVEMYRGDDVARHFDDVAQMLAALDIERTWAAATEVERRVLLDEFLKEITVLPDYIDVNIRGAPPIHVRYQEVGLKESGPDRVGGGTPTCFGGLQPSPLDRVQGRTSYLRRVFS